MCGRFTLTAEDDYLIEYFQLELFPDEYEPRYNIAPSQNILTAVQTENGRKAGYIKWGLVPYWVKDVKQWKPLINARAETLTEKASFKHLLEKKRCIIFADSFYEWKQVNGRKEPYRIMLKNENPFVLAGLWERNKSGDGLVTCTIITTTANSAVQDVHDRMPVILNGNEAIETWINTREYSYNEACQFIKTFPEQEQMLYRVSALVNSPKNNQKECTLPIVSGE